MSVPEFAIGQRWVSDAEPELGLGLVLETDGRIVRLVFPAADEERAYAIDGAPLSRLKFAVGDRARSDAGWELAIEAVDDHRGLLLYSGTRCDTGAPAELPETRLAHDLQVNRPRDRLFTNQFDSNAWFDLRHDTLRHRARLEGSDLRGLLGPRIAAIPHQLYIAHEVAHRHAPRVLLADEVGLGKTIEAGLILHHQLMTERAQRALIIVPQALTSQWVLELMRRFNLNASIFDEERCAAAEDSTGANPFASEQLVLCCLDFLLEHPQRLAQIRELDWDLLVVDEAHHLRWSPESASPEYTLVEGLAATIPGVLLLTATPEQLGPASHFARLRLLDPDRFAALDRFIEEQEHYVEAAREVDALLAQGQDTQVQDLLDRHGTGRVLFRNTRAHVQGFGQRQVHAHVLDNPYPGWTLYPERDAGPDWLDTDPRVAWLLDWLRRGKHKALVICAHKQTAMALEEHLHFRKGVRSAAFHEDLGLLARDRAAAWFADDGGAQALICSEIGSEGRNFQFVQHLVLFDLPTQPDLLEQRIGRLDRIGQRGTVHIHVPYLQSSPQALLFEWYQDGLGSFEQFCHAGSQLRALFADEIEQALTSPAAADQWPAVISRTRARRAELDQELEQGRDRLLELGSCRDPIALDLQRRLLETDNDPALLGYLEQICECFGIESDSHDEHSLVLRPATNYEEGFRDISEDGTTVTADRDTALAKEDYKFLSWEHPLLTEAMDRVLGGHRGNTALGVVEGTSVEPGTLMLECLFSCAAVAPRALQLGRYLPPQLLRVVIDHDCRIRDEVPVDAVRGQIRPLALERVKPVLQARESLLATMLDAAEGRAEQTRGDWLAAARERVEQDLRPELERLRYLKTVNPSVRDDEIEHMARRVDQVLAAIEQARISLAAVRVLVAG